MLVVDGFVTRYSRCMVGPRRVTDTGFEVWKTDRTKGRYIFMTRADEDRLCAALRETFGNFQVINAHKTFDSPKVEWRDRITAFPISSSPPDAPYGVSTVEIYFPWPKWELRAEPWYLKEIGTEEEKLASYAGHVVLTTPPPAHSDRPFRVFKYRIYAEIPVAARGADQRLYSDGLVQRGPVR